MAEDLGPSRTTKWLFGLLFAGALPLMGTGIGMIVTLGDLSTRIANAEERIHESDRTQQDNRERLIRVEEELKRTSEKTEEIREEQQEQRQLLNEILRKVNAR